MKKIRNKYIENNKVNQHYVWKKYLESWSKEGKLSCLRNSNKIISTNPRNIASERYFYNISSLSYDDCQLIRKIFIDNKPDFMKEILNGWVEPIENFLIKYSSFKNGENSGETEEIKENGLKNILENLYMHIESAGSVVLEKLKLGEDLSFQEVNYPNNNYIDFLLYLSFQYFRTKKIKESVKESLGRNCLLFSNFDHSFNVIGLILSTSFAYSLYDKIKNKKLFLILIKNNTTNDFITGDQPVINIYAAFKGETTKLELYYPVSPKMALIITEEANYNTELSSDRVRKYNNLIEEQSLSVIFAYEKYDLEKYKR